MPGTSNSDYTERLKQKSEARWKRVIDVQAPYRWNLRRQRLGRTLDVGCGIGRNLGALGRESLGVDHNATSVAEARSVGHNALTVDEWRTVAAEHVATFDGLLVAHVIEHLSGAEASALLEEYLPALRPGGRVFLVCPQERGYASDHTHVQWTTAEDLQDLARRCGLVVLRSRSFPGPRWLGRVFTYNEFTVLATKP